MSGSSSSRCSSALPMRSFISPAAALVKSDYQQPVNVPWGCPGSVTRERIRSTSTAVLPEPAAALTRMFLSRRRIACSCSFVHLFSHHSASSLICFRTSSSDFFADSSIFKARKPLVKSADAPVGASNRRQSSAPAGRAGPLSVLPEWLCRSPGFSFL